MTSRSRTAGQLKSLLRDIAQLSPEKRALLERKLGQEGIFLPVFPITPIARDQETYPLSFAQRRLWFLDRLDPGSAQYNLPSALRLSGSLQVGVFRDVLDELVQRHESLRTVFVAQAGEPRQRVLAHLSIPLQIHDLSQIPEIDREAEARRLVSEEARRAFDLSTGPLLRALLVKLAADDHLSVLTMHHIVSDGWSMGVLMRELITLYQAFAAGQPSPLPALAIQTIDYAHWQRNWLTSPRLSGEGEASPLQEQLGYWKQQLAGIPGMLELPTDRPRPAVQTLRGKNLRFDLPERIGHKIKALAQNEGTTLFQALLAAFQTLLYRYSQQEDICVGTPVSGRTRAEIEPLIGFFVNTLVIRTFFGDRPSFRNLLGRVRDVTVAAYANQDVPFEMLVEELQPRRDLSTTPLFQAMFLLQNQTSQAQRVPGLVATPVEAETDTSKFDLTLSLADTPHGLRGSVEYNPDLFDESTVRRLTVHFEALLESIVADPDQSVAALPLLNEAERCQVLFDWNSTSTGDSLDRCVHELIEAQVESKPDAIALVCDTGQWSYGKLMERADGLARHLQSLGAGPEELVGIALDRSPELVIALLGILKSGAAYVPIDPNYPKDRQSFMLEDAQISILLTQQAWSTRLPTGNATVVCIEDAWSTDAPEDDNAVHGSSPATTRNLAYVLFTSGSTGRPKGVAIEHRNAVALIRWAGHTFNQEELAGVLGSTSISFDLSVFELFNTLSWGGTVILAENALELRELPASSRVTLINTVPSAMSSLLRSGELPPGTRTVNLAGEPLPAQLVDQVYEQGSVERVYDLYGPSEDTTYSTYALRQPSGVETIGRPVLNSQAYILDYNLQPQPIGVPGELYLGGAGVARGYLNRPALTAERFLPNPFSEQPGSRLYRTGDLGRFLPDGNIKFLGRIDHQVKVRGFRIELGEIDAVLSSHPRVKEAITIASGRDDGKRLVAYVVADNGSAQPTSEAKPPSKQGDGDRRTVRTADGPFTVAVAVGGFTDELRVYLRGRLPDYMVPSVFVALEALPLTPNGKVDRKALPTPEDESEEGASYVAPRTATEEILAGIWAEVLAKKRIGANDNFFEVGGHSLLATQVISRLVQAFQVELPVRALFERPTVALLAQEVDRATHDAAGLQAPPILSVPRDRDLPLSFAQQRLWFLDQLDPGSPLYNIPDAVRVRGPLSVAALEHSLNKIVERHEVLRANFPTVDGKPVLKIRQTLRLELPVVDLGHLPAGDQEAEAFRIATEEAQRPFDLALDPLIRAKLVRLSEGDHIVLVTMHHIVSDGWSSGVFMRELGALYRLSRDSTEGALPALRIQYADFAHWQRQWLQGEVLERQLGFWKESLEGLPPVLDLPTDRQRSLFHAPRGSHHSFRLPKEVSEAVYSLSRREGATVFMTLLAALQVLLYRYSGQEDFGIGTTVANRNRLEIEPLIGFFVNTLVMRADLSGGPSFRELLARVRETALRGYAHQDVPFEMLVDALQPQRDMSHTPLFQVMFMLQNTTQNAPADTQASPGLSFDRLEVSTGLSHFDLTVAMSEGTQGLQGVFEFNADLFDLSTIERMAGHFVQLLKGITAKPDLPVSRFSLLSEHERREVLDEWNLTAADYPAATTIHARFTEQAVLSPDAVASVAESIAGSDTGDGETAGATEIVTYEALNKRANQLAHYLLKREKSPGAVVALALDRTLDALVGIMAVLKAGHCYLPLDPSYPPDRLAFMMQDSGAAILLTQRHLLGSLPQELAEHAAKEILLLDAHWPAISAEPTSDPEERAWPESIAYVIYTSGSTGKPKGVMIAHRSALNLAMALDRAAYGKQTPDALAGRDDRLRLSLNAPLSFDASVQQLVMLTYGHTLVIVPQAARTDGRLLLDFTLRQRLDQLDCVPTQLRLLLDAGLLNGQEWVPSVLFPGGEAIDAPTWSTLAKAERTESYNMYGPTECAVDSTAGMPRLKPDQPTIGRPLSNVRVYVLDQHMEPVPVGIPGELFIGGAGVARGYLNRPGLTADRFLPNRFVGAVRGSLQDVQSQADLPYGERLYRTGDLVRYLPDGNLEFLGRNDFQVKVRGFRIELGEIESVLRRHPSLSQAAVSVREDTSGDRRLVAYIVPASQRGEPGDESAPTVGELRDFLGRFLPAHMVPALFVTLQKLPLTPNGKLDRGALPAPDQSRPELGTTFVEPSTSQELALAAIWKSVLGVEQVGVHDNFFELGGDSILSIQVVARANQAGLPLTPKQLFQAPTIAGLAALVGTTGETIAEQGTVTGPVPLTPIQHYFFGLDVVKRHHWNQSLMLTALRPLEEEYLRQTITSLLLHHDAFRLRYYQEDGHWQQENSDGAGIGEPESVPLWWHDLSEVPEEETSSAIEACAAQAQASLDIEHGPLVRFAYLHLGGEKPARLLIVVHHLAIDGVSWRILLEDLQTAYAQASAGQPISLPAKTTAFRDWARRLADYAQSDLVLAELPYWEAIGEHWIAPLPVDLPGGENLESSTASVNVALDAQETRALLQEVPPVYGTEINDVLLAALALAFHRWTWSPPLLISLEGHGREDLFEDVDISRTIGWFTTLTPVLLNLEQHEDLGEVLKSIKEQLRQLPGRGISYGLLRYLAPEEIREQLMGIPTPEVSFNYLGQFAQAASKGNGAASGLTTASNEAGPGFALAPEGHGPDRDPGGRRAHLIDINGGIAASRLGFEFIYSQQVHHRETIEQVALGFMDALRELIAHCRNPQAGGYTPSDFGLANLDQRQLDKVLDRLKGSR